MIEIDASGNLYVSFLSSVSPYGWFAIYNKLGVEYNYRNTSPVVFGVSNPIQLQLYNGKLYCSNNAGNFTFLKNTITSYSVKFM